MVVMKFTETTTMKEITSEASFNRNPEILHFDLSFWGRYIMVCFNGYYGDKIMVTVDENPYNTNTPLKGTYDKVFLFTGEELVKDIEEMIYTELCKFYGNNKVKRA